MAISRRKLLSSAAAVSALALSGEVFAPAIAQSRPVRIGILAPRSGIGATPGQNGIRATQWAAERFNAAGGIAGRKIELVIEEETSPKDTIERFSNLVQQEKVDCVQGIISTSVGLALGPVVEEARALTSTGTVPLRTVSKRRSPTRATSSAAQTTNAKRSCPRCSPSSTGRDSL